MESCIVGNKKHSLSSKDSAYINEKPWWKMTVSLTVQSFKGAYAGCSQGDLRVSSRNRDHGTEIL